MARSDRIGETEILLKRLDILDRLCLAPAHIRDLVEETEHSRSTINRAVSELEAESFVERGVDGIEVTTAGRLACERLERFLSELDDVLVAEEVLDQLPPDTDIDPAVVAGGDALLVSEPASFRPLERMHEELLAADRYRALIPTLEDARHVRLLYEHVVTRGNPAELVVTPEVFDTLREEFPRRMAVLAGADNFSLFVGRVPSYSVGLFDHDEQSRVHLLVFTENGSVHGSIVNDTDTALEWAETRYRECRAAATDRTDALVVDTDGGIQPFEPRPGPTLPAALERDGFVAVDIAYFGDEPVADPSTAWRAGLSLAEVHTGYAIERPQPDETGTPDSESVQKPTEAVDRGLASTLESNLAAGSHSVLLGPPGAGKSTVCKQVACEWYADDRGLVLYRETGRGSTFTAVDALVETVAAADGHTLVVVEDAARQDANAVFDAIERLDGRGDVSFLLDAREYEWRDCDVPSAAAAAIEITRVPPVREADCATLVEHFERTVDRNIKVSVDRLWVAVQDETKSDSARGHEMLRLTHRLATYADPLTDEPTALEDDVAAVREEFDDDLALTVCTLTATLVAAGVSIDRGLLYAVAEDGKFDAVDATIERLEGRVLFPHEGGDYRTVHEEWATTFLDQLLEDDETAASRRFRAGVSALLALADDSSRCERIGRHLDDCDTLGGIVSDSERWVSNTIEAVYDLFWRRVSLVALFGDGTEPPFDLPDACADAAEIPGPHWVSERFAEAGYFDRAKRAIERLDPEDPTERGQYFQGVANVAYKRGEYHEAITVLEEALVLAREQDDRADEFYCNKDLGLCKWRLGTYDEARKHFETCIERARELDDRGLEMTAYTNLGGIAWVQGEYERAREYNREKLEYARERRDRFAETLCHNNLGVIARVQGAYDRAEERHERCLVLAREGGFRQREVSCLNNLGHVASKRGSFEDARAFHEAALEIARELNIYKNQGESHWRLGAVAIDRGNVDNTQHHLGETERHLDETERHLDEAEWHLDEAEAIFEEGDNQLYIARVRLEQARLALERGEHAEARKLAENAHAITEELEAVNERSECRTLLGRIALAENDPDRAREHWIGALDTFQSKGIYDHALRTLKHLVEVCHAEGDVDGVHRWYHRAQELSVDVPDATAALHQEWLDDAENVYLDSE